MRQLCWTWILLSVGAGACAKSLEELAPFPCAEDGACPDGFRCDSNVTCVADPAARSDGGSCADTDSCAADGGGARDGGPARDGGTIVDGGTTIDGGTFTTCSQALQCFLGCDTSTNACLDSCQGAVRAPATASARTLHDCLASHCSRQSGTTLAGCARSQCAASYGACHQAECPAAASFVYAVDSSGILYRFDPTLPAAPLRQIAQLTCAPATAGLLSMTVDRAGTAWLLYDDLNIYWVNTTTGACRPSSYRLPRTASLAFSSTPSAHDLLYLSEYGATNLLTFDTAADAGSIGNVGPMPASSRRPELTGTALGQLYGYFQDASAPFVAKLDRSSGGALQTWPVPTLVFATAWTAAHWGGKVYLFVTDTSLSGGAVSRIIVLDLATGLTSQPFSNLGMQIDAAGASICTPLQ